MEEKATNYVLADDGENENPLSLEEEKEFKIAFSIVTNTDTNQTHSSIQRHLLPSLFQCFGLSFSSQALEKSVSHQNS
jgi:hypothetical protein